MSDVLKNRNLYFILSPILIGIWILYVWAVSLPAAEKNHINFEREYQLAQVTLLNIIKLDPERLTNKDKKTEAGQFDFADVVDRIAREFSIPAKDYQLTIQKAFKSEGRLSQSASISVKAINIERMSGFLSKMLSHWPDLECNDIKLIRVKNTKDAWDVTFKLTYYF